MNARTCSERRCGNSTKDPSGRCHHHRGPHTWGGLQTHPYGLLPSPTTTARGWQQGQVHPVGGYDRVIEETYGEADEFAAETAYFLGTELHRLDGPARVVSDGQFVNHEEWHEHGVPHRSDGPASVRYDSGALESEDYYVRGRRHRLDGPAVVHYADGGRTFGELYFVNGESWPKEKHDRLREAIESGAPEEWAMAYAEGAED